jgi:hypothetical protein
VGRENGNLGAVTAQSGVPLNLQMSETRILIRLLWMYFPRNWEFGSASSKLRNFGGSGGGVLTPPPSGTPLSLLEMYQMSCTPTDILRGSGGAVFFFFFLNELMTDTQ